MVTPLKRNSLVAIQNLTTLVLLLMAAEVVMGLEVSPQEVKRYHETANAYAMTQGVGSGLCRTPYSQSERGFDRVLENTYARIGMVTIVGYYFLFG